VRVSSAPAEDEFDEHGEGAFPVLLGCPPAGLAEVVANPLGVLSMNFEDTKWCSRNVKSREFSNIFTSKYNLFVA
jgi:hypothetical protein